MNNWIFSQVLYEIRVDCDLDGGVTSAVPSGGLWLPDIHYNRKKLMSEVDAANRLFGDGTHWLDERQA